MKFLIAILALLSVLTFGQSLRTGKYDSLVPNDPVGTSVLIGPALTIGSATTLVDDILDEDTMVSDSATVLATQQSIKAYTDTSIAGVTAENVTMNGGPLFVKDFFDFTFNKAILSDLVVTDDGGLNFSWTLGTLYDIVTKLEVSTIAGSGACTDNDMTYLVWVSGAGLTVQLAPASGDEIGVAEIGCQNGDIVSLIYEDPANTLISNMHGAQHDILPLVVTDGLVLTEDTDIANVWDVSSTAGTYYIGGHDKNTIAAIDSRTTAMVRHFKTAGAWSSDTNAEVDPTQYNDGTNLATVSGTAYYKSCFYIANSMIHWIYPTVGVTQSQALESACPELPPGLENAAPVKSLVLLGSAAVLPNSDSTLWRNIRPNPLNVPMVYTDFDLKSIVVSYANDAAFEAAHATSVSQYNAFGTMTSDLAPDYANGDYIYPLNAEENIGENWDISINIQFETLPAPNHQPIFGSLNNGTGREFLIAILGTNIYVSCPTTNTYAVIAGFPADLNAGVFNDINVTRAGDVYNLFVNGNPWTSNPFTVTACVADGEHSVENIGIDQNASTQPLDGYVESFSIASTDYPAADISGGYKSSAVVEQGSIYYNTVSLAVRDYKDGQWRYKESITPWTAAATYSIGMYVNKDDSLYICKVDHTSGVFATDLASSYWTILSGGGSGGGTGGSSTGLYSGGALSIGAPTSTFSISDGFGHHIDNTTNPAVPVDTEVTWTGLTNIAVTTISEAFTEIGIDSTGSVVQSAGIGFSNIQRRDIIVLGRIVHVGGTVVEAVTTRAQVGYDSALSVYDLANSMGIIKVQGGVVSANGANLNLDLSSGSFFAIGENFVTAVKDPNTITTIADAAFTFFYNYRDGVGGRTIVPGQTAIVPGSYDDGDGTLGVVPNNNWTIHRTYFFPSSGLIVTAYGQNLYSNLVAAGNGLTTGVYDADPSLSAGILLSSILVKGNATDLSDSAEASFIRMGKFGESSVGGTGATTTNFQSTYENSLQPQVVLNSTLNGMEFRDALVPIGVSLFAIQDNAGASFLDVLASHVEVTIPFQLAEIVTPAAPAASTNSMYFKADGNLYKQNSAGIERRIGERSLDISHMEDFEGAVNAASATSGNNATYLTAGTFSGALSDETASPIAGVTSIKYAAHATTPVINDWFDFGSITIDDKQKGQTVYLSAWLDLSAFSTDVEVVVWDVTNSVKLNTALDLFTGGEGKARFATSVHIPSNCNAISFGAHMAVLPIATETFLVDDISLSTDPTSVLVNIETITRWTDYIMAISADVDPTKGTIVRDESRWRRVGEDMEITYSYEQSAAGTAGTGNYLFGLPSGYTIDSTKIHLNAETDSIVGIGWVSNTTNGEGDFSRICVVTPASTTQVKLTCKPSTDLTSIVSPSFGGLDGAVALYNFKISVPITGWAASSESVATPSESTVEYFEAEDIAGLGSTATQIPHYTTVVKNTVSTLGTMVHDSTNGTSFTASQAVTVIISFSHSTAAAGQEMGISVDGSPTTAVTGLTAAQIKALDFISSANGSATVAKSIDLEDGQVLRPHANSAGIGITKYGNVSMTITKRDVTFVSTIPKVRIAVIKDVRAAGVAGGDFTSGTWHPRVHNIVEGDTEMVTLANGTTGVGGTANQFTLKAGTYYLRGDYPGRNVDAHKARLYDVTNSVVIGYPGQSNMAANGSNVQTIAIISKKITIGATTTFRIEHRGQTAQGTDGMGRANSFGVEEVHGVLTITGAITNQY